MSDNILNAKLTFEIRRLENQRAELHARISGLKHLESTPGGVKLLSSFKDFESVLVGAISTFKSLEHLHGVGTQIVEILEQQEDVHAECVERYKDVPLCKTITDFLRYHNVQSITLLAPKERRELTARMQHMFGVLERTSKELLAVYEVTDESALSEIQRKVYDARMKAVVESNDHYP